MPAKDLGIKHSCWKCGTKFYDLRKAAPACPKCGADPRESPALKSPAAERRARAAARPEPAEEPEAAGEGGEKDQEDGEEEEVEAAEDEDS